VQVRAGSFESGLLKIELVREIPEAMKRQRISVNGQSTANVEKLDTVKAG
jgi:molecular chaperone IbpA